MSVDTPESSAPSLPERLSRLDTVNRVRREMVKVYWQMKHGEIESPVGSRLIFALTAIGKCIEFETVEDRLDAIEQALQGRAPALEVRSLPKLPHYQS